MAPELGHIALILALCVALIQSVLPLAGAQTRDPALMATAKPAAYAQFLLVALAFGCLIYSFVVSDFTVENVVQSQRTQSRHHRNHRHERQHFSLHDRPGHVPARMRTEDAPPFGERLAISREARHAILACIETN